MPRNDALRTLCDAGRGSANVPRSTTIVEGLSRVANDPHFFAGSAAFGASSTELTLAAGLLLGNKYRLLRPAGFGGMGTVWVAQNEATAAEVALKVLVTNREGVDQEAIA